MTVLIADPGVSRLALSRGMRLQNNHARPIVQSGTITDTPLSDIGLDGEGVVVGIADTGIDQESCYFYDPKGRFNMVLIVLP